jgi:hypothetical protein
VEEKGLYLFLLGIFFYSVKPFCNVVEKLRQNGSFSWEQRIEKLLNLNLAMHGLLNLDLPI